MQVCVEIHESAPGEGIIVLGVHVPFRVSTVITDMTTAEGETKTFSFLP